MKLWQRFKKLSVWNKLGVIGALASLVALPLAIIPYLSEDEPQHRITWVNVFNELDEKRLSGEQDIIASRTFWLLKEPGATITLGPCPGEKCYEFALGELENKGGSLSQRVYIEGAGFGIQRYPDPNTVFRMDAQMSIQGSYLARTKDGTWIGLSLAKGTYCSIATVNADILLTVLDTRAESLRIKLDVRPGTRRHQ